jgi:PST family polysaccharide transporter
MAEPTLGQVATRGAAMLGVSQAIRIVTSFASSIFVARLLTPADYGVVAMVAPVMGFILIFQNLGLNQAVVQRTDLSAGQINGIFWVNSLATLAIALLFVLIAPLVGRFYSDPRVIDLMAASGLTVLASGISSQHVALLNRNMRFGAISAVEATSAITGLLATILLGWWLRNYWALFLGTLIGISLGSAVAWRSERWRPSLRRLDLAATRPLLSMGADITGFNLLNFISRNLDNLLIARWWGAGQLGLYDRSYRLMLFPLQALNQPLGKVMLPALSRTLGQPAAFRSMYLLAVRALVLAIVPGAIALSVCSTDVIVLLLGEQWRGAGPIFAWLGLTAAIQPISNSTGWLFISSGRTRAMVRWGVISATMTVASFLIGLPWGAVGVAAAYTVSEILRIPLLYRMSTRDTPVSARDLYGVFLPSMLGAGACVMVVSALRNELEPLPLLGLTLVLAYGLATAAQLATASGRAALLRLLGLVRAAGRRNVAGRAAEQGA